MKAARFIFKAGGNREEQLRFPPPGSKKQRASAETFQQVTDKCERAEQRVC